mgnify:CR=1 FL=1
MAESDELSAAIGHIKYKVDSMDRTLERLLRVNGKAMLADYLEQLGLDPVLKQVYLEVDGSKTQQQIAEAIGKSNATVTGKTKRLEELDLIELVRYNNSGKIFQHTKMETIFKISRQLKKETSK